MEKMKKSMIALALSALLLVGGTVLAYGYEADSDSYDPGYGDVEYDNGDVVDPTEPTDSVEPTVPTEPEPTEPEPTEPEPTNPPLTCQVRFGFGILQRMFPAFDRWLHSGCVIR